jgi:hypothetical protein
VWTIVPVGRANRGRQNRRIGFRAAIARFFSQSIGEQQAAFTSGEEAADRERKIEDRKHASRIDLAGYYGL